jgi:hypothetical protein
MLGRKSSEIRAHSSIPPPFHTSLLLLAMKASNATQLSLVSGHPTARSTVGGPATTEPSQHLTVWAKLGPNEPATNILSSIQTLAETPKARGLAFRRL